MANPPVPQFESPMSTNRQSFHELEDSSDVSSEKSTRDWTFNLDKNLALDHSFNNQNDPFKDPSQIEDIRTIYKCIGAVSYTHLTLPTKA